jgi:hypothetical protein
MVGFYHTFRVHHPGIVVQAENLFLGVSVLEIAVVFDKVCTGHEEGAHAGVGEAGL